jgi:hypothetical protein
MPGRAYSIDTEIDMGSIEYVDGLARAGCGR